MSKKSTKIMTKMKSSLKNDHQIICRQDEDGNLEIEWGSDHPMADVLNSWTQEDFIAVIFAHLKKLKINGKQTGQRLPKKVSAKPSNAKGVAGKETANTRKGRKSTTA